MNNAPLILIVDDDLNLQRAAVRLMNQAGYRTCQASDGNTGLQIARAEKPDLVLLDVNLPDRSGMDICRDIKADPGLIGCFVVLLSAARIDPPSRVEGLEGGADGYIVRPVTNEELVARVRGMLRIQQTERRLRENEQRWRDVIAHNQDGMVVVDQAGNIQLINPAAIALLKRAPDDLLDKPFGLPIATNETCEIELIQPDNQLFTVEMRANTFEWMGRPAFLVSLRDTTRRAHEEEMLRISEAKFKYVFDHTPIGTSLTQPSGEIDVNQAFCDMLGYTAAELVNKKWQDITYPADINLNQTVIDALLAGAQDAVRFTKRYLHKSGAVVWADVSTALRRDSTGKPLYFMTAMIDITARKLEEESLRESDEKFAKVFQTSPYAIAITRPEDGKYIEVNDAFTTITGYTREEALASSSLQLNLWVHEAERNAIGVALGAGQAVAGKECSFRRKDGSIGIGLFSAQLLKFKNGMFVLSSIDDITERKRIEAMLRIKDDAIASSLNAIAIADLEGNLTYVNPAFLRMWGFTDPSQVLGHNATRFWQVQNRAAQVVTALQTGNSWVGELPGQRADGSSFVAEVSATMVRDPNGQPLAMLAAFADITERKQAEKRILHLNRLYAILSQINQAIVRAREPQTLFQEICRVIIEHGNYHMTWIGWVDETSQTVKPIAFAGEEQGYLANLHVTYRDEATAKGPTGTAIREGRSVICEDIANNPLMQPWRTSALARGYRSSVAVPIRQSDQIVGALTIYAAEPDGFDAEDKQLVDEIGTDISFALETMHSDNIRKQVEQSLRESEARYRYISSTISDIAYSCATDPDGTYALRWMMGAAENMVGYSVNEFMAQRCWGFLVIPEDEGLFHQHVTSLRPGESSSCELRLRHKNGETIWVASYAECVAATDSSSQHLYGALMNITERKRRERELEIVALVSTALRTAMTHDEMIPVIVRQVSHLLNAPSVSLGLIMPDEDASIVMGAEGGWADTIGQQIPLKGSISGQVLATGKPYLTDDLGRDPLLYLKRAAQDLRGGACVPLIAQGEAIGWLFVGVPTLLRDDNMRILNAIADIAANAIRRAAWHERTKQTAAELERAYETTLEGWAHALELRDQETTGHARRVVQLAVELAQAMGVPAAELPHMRRGALLHDIGKMGVPDSVLLKHGTLNDREWEIMRRHPEYGYHLLQPIEYLRPALDIPYCHHEKWDGTGYPRGLKGEAIPLAARIFAIVDVWDALCSDRPYRAAWSNEQTLAYIQSEAGKHFDPAIVELFLKMVG